jgi:hypothetical protein
MGWKNVARSLANVWQHKVKSVAKYSDISSGVGQLVLNGQELGYLYKVVLNGQEHGK